jgi:hypothetical protein
MNFRNLVISPLPRLRFPPNLISMAYSHVAVIIFRLGGRTSRSTAGITRNTSGSSPNVYRWTYWNETYTFLRPVRRFKAR